MKSSAMKPAVRLASFALLAAAIAMLAMLAAAGTAQASPMNLDNAKSTVHVSMWKKGEVLSLYSPSNKKITKVKSSNTKVAVAKAVKKKNMNGGYPTLNITKKKPGTTKITYTYKGKKRTLKLVIHKYVNPVKSLKIGSYEFAKYFDVPYGSNDDYIDLGYDEAAEKNITGAIKIKPKSGWKVYQIVVVNYKSGKEKTVKNGYKLKSSESVETIIMKNKKTGMIEYVYG